MRSGSPFRELEGLRGLSIYKRRERLDLIRRVSNASQRKTLRGLKAAGGAKEAAAGPRKAAADGRKAAAGSIKAAADVFLAGPEASLGGKVRFGKPQGLQG
jgi:hypothetical protein